jgi:hypothetical protein
MRSSFVASTGYGFSRVSVIIGAFGSTLHNVAQTRGSALVIEAANLHSPADRGSFSARDLREKEREREWGRQGERKWKSKWNKHYSPNAVTATFCNAVVISDTLTPALRRARFIFRNGCYRSPSVIVFDVRVPGHFPQRVANARQMLALPAALLTWAFIKMADVVAAHASWRFSPRNFPRVHRATPAGRLQVHQRSRQKREG